MTKATIAPNVFSRLYNEFRTASSTDTLSHVLYYKENNMVHIFMKYLGITYCTRIGVEDRETYFMQFNSKIPLVEKLD